MFSYLRPHHKRTSSNPSSPADPSASFEHSLRSDHGHPQRQQDAGFPEQPSRAAPMLPPIARVSSPETNINTSRSKGFERDVRTQNFEASRNNGTRPPDIQTYSNAQRPQYGKTTPTSSTGNAVSTSSSSSMYSRTQNAIAQDTTSKQSSRAPNSHNTSLEPQSRSGPLGRRAHGVRMPSPPPASSSNYSASTFEPAPARSSKTRLNLLNPMSLLARRRTSQAITQLSPESLVSGRNQSNFNETFDPRIRGTVVHDFSAPRPPRRNQSYNDVQVAEKNAASNSKQHQSPNGNQSADDNLGSPWSNGHTPVFTENFEEEQYPAAGPHVRKASDLTDLPLPKPPYAKGVQKAIFDPSSTQKSNEVAHPISQSQPTTARNINITLSDKPLPIPPPMNGGPIPEQKRISIDPSSTPPKTDTKKGRSRNVSEVSIGTIPKHMKSTSSRFSFDMIGAAEQERLLEDRHRQKALEKKIETPEPDERMDEYEDDYDYDNMDDDDGLEERIPGVNADYEEDPYDFGEDEGNVGGFSFQQSNLGSPMSPASPGMVSTPRDANGEVIGFAMTKNSPFLSLGMAQSQITSPNSPLSPDLKSADNFSASQGLGLQGVCLPQVVSPGIEQAEPETESIETFPRPSTLDDDDLYFDDGIIGGPGDDENTEFDESIFDNVDTDEYGRPLQPMLAQIPTLYVPPTVMPDITPPLARIAENEQEERNIGDGVSPETITESNGLAPRPSVLGGMPPASHGLTQDSLAAYQSALAAAAFSAAASGKFRRDETPPNPTPSEPDDAHPGLVADSSQTSHYEPYEPAGYEAADYEAEDDFDYDDALEDDPIIAAANAEALANDCDGFYGQEFGFYSAPAGQAEYANGGYFGPRGVDGLNRATSGRVASREPNLTPITERSEYSNRNSFMGLNMHNLGHGAPSPGLAQLAGMLRSPADYDGDMSLDALLKLRRGAWGGSQASLHSSNGSPRSPVPLEDSSPVGSGQPAPWNQGGHVTSNNGTGHRRNNSAFSLASDSMPGTGVQSEASSMPGSPTLTMNFPLLEQPQRLDESAITSPEKEQARSPDKEKRGSGGFAKKHRYNSSAESISYLKEDDPVEGARWILERRRTAEDGNVELLGREVVSGGRI